LPATAQAAEPAGKVTTKAVAEPLKKAQEAMKNKQWDAALTAIKQAQAAEKKTPFETYQIDEFLGYVLIQQKKFGEAAPVFERMLTTGFVPAEQVDLVQLGKPYFCDPTGADAKPYVLLRDSLEGAGKVAIVKMALRQRERLAMLRARDGVLVLQTLLWPDEVREPKFGFLDEDVTVRPQELQMAESYIAALSGDFEPEQYSDDYREALEEVIDAKIAGREVKAPVEAPRSGQVVDLMEALRRSVAEAKSRRGEGAQDGASEPAASAAKNDPGGKGATKKTTAKKAAKSPAAARKAAKSTKAAKKTTEKKAATRRSA